MITGSKLVLTLGKYLYKHIDSAFKYKQSGNMYDVYFYVYYQLPRLNQDWTKSDEYNDIHEMTLNLNITTYSNKLRFNVIQVSESEETIGQYIIPIDKLQDIRAAHQIVLEKLKKLLNNKFADYEFVF